MFEMRGSLEKRLSESVHLWHATQSVEVGGIEFWDMCIRPSWHGVASWLEGGATAPAADGCGAAPSAVPNHGVVGGEQQQPSSAHNKQ